MTIEEYTKQNTPKDQKSGSWKKFFVASLFVGVVFFCLGFYVGQGDSSNKPTPRINDDVFIPLDSATILKNLADSIEKAKEDSARASIKMKVDSVGLLNNERSKRAYAKMRQKSYDEAKALEAKNIASSEKKDNKVNSKKNNNDVKQPEKQVTVTQQQTNQQQVLQPKAASISVAQRKMQTGAYNIVGTAKTVVVKKGQTLQSISDRALGPGMECYIQVHNGVMEASEGDNLKIPALELKKKTQKTASGEN